MGEAKRKRDAMAREWVPLFSPDLPAKVAISRPSLRAITTRTLENRLRDDIARRANSKEPALCFYPDAEHELRVVPQVFAFLATTSDPKAAPPIGMGICRECAARFDDDDAIRAILRTAFARFGLDGVKEQHVKIEFDMEAAFAFEAVPGVPIVIAARKLGPNDEVCMAASQFAALLRGNKLPRFLTFRNGAHNCHALVNQLYLDLKDIGAASLFAFKRGESTLLKTQDDPEGLHSWIEKDGWAIDGSGGALGNPIIVQTVEDFYARWQLSKVRDALAEPDIEH
jgi:hypothetical protein